MSNNNVINQKNEMSKLDLGNKGLVSKHPTDSSQALMTVSTSNLVNAMQNIAEVTSPTTLNMISKQKKKIEEDQAQIREVLDTLATQIENSKGLPKGSANGFGQLSSFMQSLTQGLPQEGEQNPFLGDSFTSQLGATTDISALSMILQESRKLDPKSNDKKNGLGNGLGATPPNAGKSEKNPTSQAPGRDAIFAAAGEMAQLQGKEEDKLAQELENEIKMLEAQRIAMENMLQYIKKEGALLQKYLSNPTLANLKALVNFLESALPNEKGTLDDIVKQAEYIIDKYGFDVWKKCVNTTSNVGTGKYHFHLGAIHIDEIKTHASANYDGKKMSINQALKDMSGAASGNPTLFAQFMKYGQEYFTKQIKEIIQAMSEIEGLLSIITGGGSQAIFEMEAILMNMEQLSINNNSKQSEQKTEMAQAVRKGLEGTMQKLTDAINKIVADSKKSQHHGIFGVIADFFKSLWSKMLDILKSVKDLTVGFAALMTGHSQQAAAAFEKSKQEAVSGLKGYATFFKAIYTAYKDICVGLIKGNFSQVLQGVTLLTKDTLLIAAIALSGGVFGPLLAVILGPMLADSKFGEDMNNLGKVGIDLVVSAGAALVAGIAKLEGVMGVKGANDLGNDALQEAKKMGKAAITNPEFQTFMDVIAIIVIVCSVASQQYWLAGIMAVMLVANDFGGTQWVESKITDLIVDIVQDCKGSKLSDKDKEWCRVAADVIVIAAVIATGSFSGAFEVGVEEAGETAAEELAEDGTEALGEGAEGAGSGVGSIDSTLNETEDELQDVSVDTMRKAVKFLKAMGKAILRALKNNGKLLMTLGMTIGSTSIGVDLAKAIEKPGEHKLEQIFEYIQMGLAVALSLTGGAAMSLEGSADTLSRRITDGLRKLGKLGASMVDDMEENMVALTRLSMAAQGTQSLLNSGAQIGNGLLNMEIAKYIKLIGQYNAEIELFSVSDKDINSAIQQNNQHLKQIMKGYEQIVKNFNAPSLTEEGIENALLQNA